MAADRSLAIELARVLDASPAPVYALDEDRRIVYCNPACAALVGQSVEELVGRQCAYHTSEESGTPAAFAASLCPPPKVFSSGRAETAIIRCTAADGTTVARRGHFLPLARGEDECAEVLAVLEMTDHVEDAAAARADTQLHEEVRRFRSAMAERFRQATLIGNSPAIVRARAQIAVASGTRAGVLLLGPRGTGKDHAAKAIHYGQPQPGTLVPVDCAVLEPNIIRSTLRALWQKHAGSQKSAATLLLTDVDFAPLEVQADLMEVCRDTAGAIRVLATAEQPLDRRVAEDRFERELAFTLSTITIELPPLCERIDDLPILAQALLEDINKESAKQVGGFTSEALDRLAGYSWPGNVDELAAVVRQAHDAATGGEVTARDLASRIAWAADAAAHPQRGDEAIVVEEFLARVEVELITRALRRAKGNKTKAARLLGLTRPRLYRRLVQLGLEQRSDNGEEHSG